MARVENKVAARSMTGRIWVDMNKRNREEVSKFQHAHHAIAKKHCPVGMGDQEVLKFIDLILLILYVGILKAKIHPLFLLIHNPQNRRFVQSKFHGFL